MRIQKPKFDIDEKIEDLKKNDGFVHQAYRLHPDDEVIALRTALAYVANERDAYRNRYRSRNEALSALARKMPEPWQTLCIDIVANGRPRWWGEGEGIVDVSDYDSE